MSPREIAEKLHDHYCVQECRWHDKPGTILAGEAEITEAIDAATKPLKAEIERLKAERAQAMDHMKAIRELRETETNAACAYADASAKLADERADQAEARNKALVEALKKADPGDGEEWLLARTMDDHMVTLDHKDEMSLCQFVLDVRAALAANEEPKQSLPKASEGA